MLFMELLQTLTYRPFTEADLPGIVQLWESHSGWWKITEEEFRKWYLETPYGNSHIIIAENDAGEIAGHLSLIPTAVTIAGRRIRALRLTAPIVHESFRLQDFRRMDHPALMMLQQGVVSTKELGYGLLYALPSHGWLKLSGIFPMLGLPEMQTATFDCVSVSLTDPSTFDLTVSAGFIVERILAFDSGFNDLWNEAAKSFPVYNGVIRDAHWLNWKRSDHLALKVTRQGELAGYALFKKKDGLVVDTLARTANDLKRVLHTCVNVLHDQSDKQFEATFKQVKFMCSHPVNTIIKGLPISPVNFEFAFFCHSLSAEITKETIRPDNWYLMPLD
jgi:hypothetical protein